MFRKRKCEPDWELIDILKHDIDYQNAELWKAAAEIERLRDQIRALEAGTYTPPVNEEEPF